MPWRQFTDTIDRMVGNAFQQDVQIGLRAPAVQLGHADQGVDDSRPLAAYQRFRGQIVFPPKHDIVAMLQRLAKAGLNTQPMPYWQLKLTEVGT